MGVGAEDVCVGGGGHVGSGWVERRGGGEGGREEGEGDKEAQREWAMSGGESTAHSVATPGGLACPISQLADREDPAAWRCCR